MKKMLIAIVLMAGVFSVQAETVGKIAEVYQGDNIKITFLRYGDAKNEEYLLQVSGIDNEFDGLILKHKKVCGNTDCSTFKMETKDLKGKKRWWTFHQEKVWGGSTYYAFPYLIDKRVNLYKTKVDDKFNPLKFLETYKRQK